MRALELMTPQVRNQERFLASFFLILASETNAFDHIKQNGVHLDIFGLLGMTVGASSILRTPSIDASLAKQTVLAAITLDRLTVFGDYQVANSA